MYPIALNLEGKPVLIIGAGGVGERKIMSLLDAGADIEMSCKSGLSANHREIANFGAA